MPDAIAQFAKAKYLNLETFRKTGVGVRTPVWFAQDPGTCRARFFTWRQRRLLRLFCARQSARSSGFATIPECGLHLATFAATSEERGWMDTPASATARKPHHGQELLRRKYGWMKIVGDFFSRLRGRTQAVIAIHID